MKRKLISVLVLLVLGLLFSRADASVTVTANFTTDNVLAAFYQDGSAPVLQSLTSGDPTSWGVRKTATIVLPSGPTSHTYQIVFQVYNEVPPGWPQYPAGVSNPAGFLADLTISGNSGSSELLSSDSGAWQYTDDPTRAGTLATFSSLGPNYFNGLSWANVTQYGNNGVSPWGTISGISNSAEWVWGPNNGAALGTGTDDTPTADNWLFIKTDITVGPVPEPATMIVWSLLGAASWLGMRVWRGGRRIGRSWSPENRQAILEVIGR
jgi:hypothetical protein